MESSLKKCFPDAMRTNIIGFINTTARESTPVIPQGFRNDYLELYLRMCKPGFTYSCLALTGSLIVARIDLDERFRDQGIFSSILSFLVKENPYPTICFEQVFGDKLELILSRKGFERQIEPDVSDTPFGEILKRTNPKGSRNWIRTYA